MPSKMKLEIISRKKSYTWEIATFIATIYAMIWSMGDIMIYELSHLHDQNSLNLI